jgi:catalase
MKKQPPDDDQPPPKRPSAAKQVPQEAEVPVEPLAIFPADDFGGKQASLEFHQELEASQLTTDQGVPIAHTDDSLKAGPRGSTLLEDFHLREKITRFDHERIPERVVHARGSGAHGFFQVYESLEDLTSADFLCDTSARTPVFVRFSTVVGSRGSSDLARDVRGFATKFYTRQGNFDLVGNNMPVFFIQDGIKFPDLVHAVKPEPHNEMPQAASAHDTFWDFVSLVPETLHMVMWVMSDRAIPRSYRMMEGFGVHTFRLINAAGKSVLCKFHWRPLLGAHSVVWEEALMISGADPDFHRRDLWDAIESGAFPEYELGLQVVPESDALTLGFDLLDPTKLIPEEIVPVRRVGKLTLNANPKNFFAEVEQVAFCIANVVPGIDFTEDPLLQARLFSYLDTQLTRLGGPNFAEIPINRPIAPVHNHQQDGFHRDTIPTERALYHPNTIAGGRPPLADRAAAFRSAAVPMTGEKNRLRSETFADHFSQARMFLRSQSEPERRHLVQACQFELAKVERLAIRERVVAHFANIDEEFANEVAAEIGVHTPVSPSKVEKAALGNAKNRALTSPALSLLEQPRTSIKTRKIAVLIADGVRHEDIAQARLALESQGATLELIAPSLAPLKSAEELPLAADKSLRTTSSVLYDAVYIPGGEASVAALSALTGVHNFLKEMYRHSKPMAASNEAAALLEQLDLGPVRPLEAPTAANVRAVDGIVLARGTELGTFFEAFIAAIREHRHFLRPFTTTQPEARRP